MHASNLSIAVSGLFVFLALEGTDLATAGLLGGWSVLGVILLIAYPRGGRTTIASIVGVLAVWGAVLVSSFGATESLLVVDPEGAPLVVPARPSFAVIVLFAAVCSDWLVVGIARWMFARSETRPALYYLAVPTAATLGALLWLGPITWLALVLPLFVFFDPGFHTTTFVFFVGASNGLAGIGALMSLLVALLMLLERLFLEVSRRTVFQVAENGLIENRKLQLLGGAALLGVSGWGSGFSDLFETLL